MSVYVANESGTEVDEVGLAALARHVLSTMGISPLAELSLMLVTEDAMERLHVQYMGEPGATDVLAFAQDDLSDGSPVTGTDEVPEALLGDVVLCPEFAARQAVQQGHPLEVELQVLTAHGVLHLLGYDHADPETEREMFGVQGQVLDAWRAASANAATGSTTSSVAGSGAPAGD
ncbi:MAG: putative rRNA maturation factor [Frankiaceae bacterium]|jgi:probable rRNA maturation factor|nr:putative rRNA maturation factor [Frankiaceae bacterium]MDQ1649025.1 putative rRNA maturation factor [Frankiaceae bacterium]MDQ1672836.1 putative rRNA maturation factor [Frankiaceae bacterium]